MENNNLSALEILAMYERFESFPTPEQRKEYVDGLINDKRANTFLRDKLDILNDLKLLIKKYEEFTKQVSPKNWRTTGHHITELKKIREEFHDIKRISTEELRIDWVKKSLEEF